MPIQFFVDDSGGKNQGRIVMAGLWAPAERWAAFSTEWDELLHAEPCIDYFKMDEAAQCVEQFARFTVQQRDAKVRGFAEIMNRHAVGRLVVSYGIAPSLEYPQEKKKKRLPLEQPYFWALHTFVFSATFELFIAGHRERFEIIFDEHKHFGEKTRQFYPALRLTMPEPARSIMPEDLLFRDDMEVLPLQAADMLAWLKRRDAAGLPHSFGWIEDVFTQLKLSRASGEYEPTPRGTPISDEETRMDAEASAEMTDLLTQMLIDQRYL